MAHIVHFEEIRGRIVVLRHQRVMLSSDLAELYEVDAKALVQAVKRNARRFPTDFMFRLSREEWSRLRSQIVTLDNAPRGKGRGRHAKYPPLAFTEHGVTMLSSVLKSRRAVEVNIQVVRAFVNLRQWLIGNRQLATKLAELEKRCEGQFRVVFEALEELMLPKGGNKRPIGFRPDTNRRQLT